MFQNRSVNTQESRSPAIWIPHGMSALNDLIKTSNTVLRHNQNSLTFCEKYPVVTINYGREIQHVPEDAEGSLQESMIRIIKEQGDFQERNTNVKADMTEWYMHKTHTCFQWVCNKALTLAERHNPHKVDMEVYDCWGAVYREGEYTKEHDHWPCLWSFVFYVDSCENCSPLVFPTGNNHKVLPKTGNLILFPSWILHSVPPQKCNHERIMIAGNIRLSK